MGFFNKKNKIEETKQDDTERGTVERVQVLYQNALTSKGELYSKWKDCYKAYTSELFKNDRGEDRANAVPNHIFSTIETVKPIMLTNQPKNIVLPKREDGFKKAMLIQEALDYEWRRTKLMNRLHEFLTNGLIYGTAIMGVFWNGKASNNLGEIEPVVISPFNFLIDPMATTIQNAEYVMYATYKSFGELVKAYPDKRDELEGSKTNNLDEELTFGKEKSNVRNQLLYIECYMRDYAVETEFEDELNESGEPTGNKYKVTKMKYPNGRRIIIAGDVLLDDGENPYNDGKFPFIEWKCYDVPGQFWGMGDVETLISVQKEICELYNDILDNAHLCGNPIWVLDKNSGVEAGSLTNRKGLVIRKNPGSEVKRDAPPSIPAYIQNVLGDLKYDVQVISGVFDATRGERPVSVTSGIAIQALNESSQGRIRLKTQKMEYMLADLGSMQLSRMQQFWTLPRTIRIMGGDYKPDTLPVMVNGQQVFLETISKDEIDGDYDIEILTGSTMAVNRSARLEQIIRLAQTPAEDGLPVIDRRTILEYTELDNVDDIIDRFEKAKIEQAQNEQQQLQMQQQAQMEQQAIMHEMDKENMALNNKAQMDSKALDVKGKQQLEMIKMVNENNKDDKGDENEKDTKKPLQKKESNLQSEEEGNGNDMSIEQFLEYVQGLSEEEFNALVQEKPEIVQILQALQQVIGE